VPDAVIVSTARTPIGRAYKSTLSTSTRSRWPNTWWSPPCGGPGSIPRWSTTS
jgi:hypothetical protein